MSLTTNPVIQPTEAAPRHPSTIVGLGALFAAMYFAQGIGEPTEGLIGQPIRSLLSRWGYSASWVGIASAWLSLPWAIKPLYGLLTDFVPCGGTRRRGYLLWGSAIATVIPLLLFVCPPRADQAAILVAMLILPGIAIAFGDVVVDALMVERGQALGRTGTLQSIQWTASYSATVLTGVLGGWLTARGLHRWSFLCCGLTSAVTWVLTYLCVHESNERRVPVPFGRAVAELRRTILDPRLAGIAAFLFLWNFNPFSTAVQYHYMTRHLGHDERFYGLSNSVLAVGAIAGSLSYGFYCRRISFPVMLHLAIATGVVCTLLYMGLTADRNSALVISWLVGFTYMTANLIQFDLAARICPTETAGTTFAALMGLANLSMLASTGLGGILFDAWEPAWGARGAFRCLVVLGSATTAGCWFLVPLLRGQNRQKTELA